MIEFTEEKIISSIVNTMVTGIVIASISFGFWMKDVAAGMFMFSLLVFILSGCVYLKKYV